VNLRPGNHEKSTITLALEMISQRDRNRLFLLLTAQVLLGVLDIIGIGLFGLVGALAVSGVRFNQPNSAVQNILNALQISDYNFQIQVAILGIAAAFFLILKTAISVVLSRRTISFLGNRGAQLSASLMSKLLNSSLAEIKRDSIQAVTYKLTGGVESITIGILGSLIGLIVDGSLLLMLVILLTVIQPLTALATFGFFFLVSISTYLLLNRRSITLAKKATTISIETNLRVNDTFSSYREITVRNSRQAFLGNFKDLRLEASKLSAEMQFLPNISKYIMETSVVVGALLVAGVQFLLTDANTSISSLAIFMMSSSRIAPAVLRVQQNAINLKSSIGQAILTFDLIERLHNTKPLEDSKLNGRQDILAFTPEIEIYDLTFTYPGNINPTLKNISMSIQPGSFVAIVGPSGSGKSTLMDCILGLHKLDKGRIEISSREPIDAFREWPDKISYVPQEVHLFSDSIRKNVALGIYENEIDDQSVVKALERAQLTELIVGGIEELEKKIGAGESSLSGGQRQRLGIARALYSRPEILFLDEATSALDANTEAVISNQLNALRGQVTLIMIAHRLSTIRNADLIVYLDEGKIIARGTFDEVRSVIPGFDSAATTMGL
jgi:ABC-type multidrug transport system fused ATPase/permease subunit